MGCTNNNDDSTKSYEVANESLEKTSYEKVYESLNAMENNPLLDYVSICNVEDYELIEENEFEYRLSFTFTIENITDNVLTMDFIGYVPEQLKSYFLARETFEAFDVTLKPGQEMVNSFAVLVLNPNKLEKSAREFLNEYGERLYMHFIIDEKDYYYELLIK